MAKDRRAALEWWRSLNTNSRFITYNLWSESKGNNYIPYSAFARSGMMIEEAYNLIVSGGNNNG